jgi:hypothetical protein
METDVSLQCSQEPSTRPYPEPDESNLYPHLISLRSILVLFSHICLGLPSGLFHFGFPTNLCIRSFPYP